MAHHHHHSHDETCDHHHESHPNDHLNTKFMVGTALNAVFIVVELTLSLERFTNSNALFADALHNLSDLIALCFSWLGIYFSQKRTAPNYTYGLRKANVIITFVNTALLLWAIIEIIRGSINQIIHHDGQVKGLYVMIIAGVGVVVNGFTAWLFSGSSHAHHHHHSHEHDDLNIKSTYLHFLADALISVGVVIAGGIMYFTKWYSLDAYISLAIAIFILFHSRGLMKEVLEYALDATPKRINLGEVKQWLLQISGVTDVHDLHIWGISTSETALTVHLVVPNSTHEPHFLEEITQHLKKQYQIQHITIQIETEPCGQNCG